MNIRLQRSIDRIFGVPLCRFFSGLDQCLRFLRLRRTATANSPQRILVILLSEMGSMVLSEPMFAQLKQRYPQAKLHVLLFAKNREILELLEFVPASQIHTLDERSLSTLALDLFKVILQLRRLRFDAVLDCELFARVSSLLSILTGAPVLVGFAPHTQEGLYRGSFITKPLLYNPYRHISHQLCSLVDALASTSHPPCKVEKLDQSFPVPRRPRLTPIDVQRASDQFLLDFPALRGKPLILIHPGGGALPVRAWPLSYYLETAEHFLQQGYAVGVIGMQEDASIGKRVCAYCEHPLCVDLTGYTQSIRHLLALFYFARLLISNDGGPGQFAALTPIATITLFGPETPQLYHSWSTRAIFLYQPLPCSPCLTAYNHRNSPCDGDNQCLKQILPQQVISAAQKLLGAELETKGQSFEATTIRVSHFDH